MVISSQQTCPCAPPPLSRLLAQRAFYRHTAPLAPNVSDQHLLLFSPINTVCARAPQLTTRTKQGGSCRRQLSVRQYSNVQVCDIQSNAGCAWGDLCLKHHVFIGAAKKQACHGGGACVQGKTLPRGKTTRAGWGSRHNKGCRRVRAACMHWHTQGSHGQCQSHRSQASEQRPRSLPPTTTHTAHTHTHTQACATASHRACSHTAPHHAVAPRAMAAPRSQAAYCC